ncbi:MAG: c-type cytochrome [Omnitrophica WOR_2 bacterium]
MTKRFLSIFLVGFALVLSACSFSLAEDITPPPGYESPTAVPNQLAQVSGPLYPLVPPNPAKGAAIYAEKCAPCHGDTGEGNGSRASALPGPVTPIGSADVARKTAPKDWYTIVTQGNLDKFMPPFASLSDGQRWDVVAYIYSLSMPKDSFARAGQVFDETCAGCHGKDGKGDGPQASGLSKAPPDFTNQAYMSQRTESDFYQAISAGVSPAMPAYQDKLSDSDRWALADYTRSLSFTSVELASAATPASPASGTPMLQVTPVFSTTSPLTATAATTNTIYTGTVTGKITNGSGGSIPAGLEVNLHGFDSMQIVITDTAKAQADGSYTFNDVPMKVGRIFLTSTSYGSASYGSEIATVEKGTNKFNLDIKVYDTTTDTSALSADRMHIFFDFSRPGIVQVIQLFIISNPGSKTVTSDKPGGPVMKFTLPEGATNLQFQDGAIGQRYIKTADGFADTQAVNPGAGAYQVLYAYDMPYNRKLVLKQPITFPVGATVVLLPESGYQLKSSQLSDGGTKDFQGTSYHMYTGNSLKAGDTLDLTLSSKLNLQPTLVIGLGSLGIVLILAGIILYRRNQLQEARPAEEPELENEFEGEDDEESLVDAIIALDDQYKGGALPEEAYRKRRAELKERLRKVVGTD